MSINCWENWCRICGDEANMKVEFSTEIEDIICKVLTVSLFCFDFKN